MKFGILLLVASALIISGCSTPKPIALKGAYSTEPKALETEATFDQVWDRLIDLFAQKGLSIKIIDRSSGLIISERSLLPFTTENNLGILKDSTAFGVVPKVYDSYSKKYKPIYTSLTGEWNVRIKKGPGGKTVINVNIVNIQGIGSLIYQGKIQSTNTPCSECRSTGVFESLISNLIK
jgi:hypothetical protein